MKTAALAALLVFSGLARAQAATTSAAIRLDQAMFESSLVLGVEKKALVGRVSDIDLSFAPDGIHASGHVPNPILSIFPDVKFTAILGLVWVAPNKFEVRVREAKISFVSVKILTKLVLDSAKTRLDAALQGICSFAYVGDKDGSQAIRVTLDMAKMMPAFPNLALIGIETKDRELVLKTGAP